MKHNEQQGAWATSPSQKNNNKEHKITHKNRTVETRRTARERTNKNKKIQTKVEHVYAY